MRTLLLIFFSFILFSCDCDFNCEYYRVREREWYKDNSKLKVLSTTAMIDDIVQQVGRDHVDSLILIRGELDPHSYQLVKGDDEKFAHANIIFYNGLGLEHGPSIQKQLAESKKTVGLGDSILKDDSEAILHYNGQLDPHIWMDIGLWTKTIPYIVETLSQQDPAHASDYRANGNLLMAEMQRADQAVKDRLQRVPENKRYLITSHDAFNYFARAYLATDEERKNGGWQKRFAAPEGLAPESQLSATDIQLIIDHMKKYDIKVLFPESNVSKDSIRKIVQAGKEHGMDLTISGTYLYGDAMGPPGSDGDTYLKMVWHNAETLSKYMSGEL